MSLANISLWSYLTQSLGNGDLYAGFDINRELQVELQSCHFPLVRFVNTRHKYPHQPTILGEEMVDFFGLCESDWRYGFATVVSEPGSGRTVASTMDSEIGRRSGFFVSMILIYDPESESTEQYAIDQNWGLVDLFRELQNDLFLELTTEETNLILVRVLPRELRSRIPAFNRRY
jgi:hypothetical protein